MWLKMGSKSTLFYHSLVVSIALFDYDSVSIPCSGADTSKHLQESQNLSSFRKLVRLN